MSDQLREAIERAWDGYRLRRTIAQNYDTQQEDFANAITAEVAPLFEAQDAGVRELEALLREARHDLHYVIRVASSDSSTDMEFTKHARVLFADEIETIEKIDAVLAGTNAGGTDG